MTGDAHDQREPVSPRFEAWARFIVNYPVVAVLVTLGLSGLSIWGVYPEPKSDMSIEAFLNSEGEEIKNLEEYRETFGRDDMFLVVAEAPGKGQVFSEPFLNKLKGLHGALATLDMEVPSLGQCVPPRRQAARAKEQAANAPAAAPETAAATKEPPRNRPAPRAETNDGGDAFGDEELEDFGDESAEFDEFEEAEGGEIKAADQQKKEWGDEAGGTIVDEIISLINVRRTRGRAISNVGGSAGTEIVVGEFMDPWPTAEQLAAKRTEALSDPDLVGRVVDKEGRYAVIVVRTQCMSEADSEKVNEHVEGLLAKYQSDDFKLLLSGTPAMMAGMKKAMLTEMQTLLSLALLLFITVMALIFRHPLGVLGPMAVVGFAAIWTFGFMALMDYPMTMLTSILPTFVICVAFGDTVHVLSVYRDKRADGYTNDDAIVSAIAGTAKPILYTTLTTAVGLLSFRFASIDAIQEMGTAAAAGVFMAFFNTILILPAMLKLNKKSLMGARRAGDRDIFDRFLDWTFGLSASSKGLRGTIVGGVLLSVAAGAGAFTLGVHHDPIEWMPEDMPVRVAFDTMDDHVGGTANIQLIIRPKSERGLKDRELLVGMEKLDRHVLDYVHADGRKVVTNSISVVDVVKETNQALNAGAKEHYALPPDQGTVSDAMFVFEQAGPEQLRRMATTDLKTSQMTLNVNWMEATSYKKLVAHVQTGIDAFIGDKAEVKPTGMVFTMVTTEGTLIFNLMKSFAIAFVVISLLMMALLRDIRLGLVAMVPNLMPIALIMGTMAALGIDIDMANLLLASIAMGLAVDDTIHFLHHFKLHYDAYGGVEAAIQHSKRHAGRALVATTVILAAGFYVFLAAELGGLKRFGGLIATAVVYALLVDLMFGPALLRLIYKDKEPAVVAG